MQKIEEQEQKRNASQRTKGVKRYCCKDPKKSKSRRIRRRAHN